MTRPEIVVFAYSEVGYRCLEYLLDSGANVKAVFSYSDRQGENIWFHSVAELARSRGVELVLDADLKNRETCKWIKKLKPRIIFSFYYRDIIPDKVLKMPKLGAFNVHGSLLPRYRGRACVNWTILNGESETGATLHRMTKKPDEGDIIDQEVVSIGRKDTARDVMIKVSDAAAEILRRSLPAIEDGDVRGVKQDDTMSTYFGGRKPQDGLIKWTDSTKKIYNLVRAVTDPYPGAFSFFKGKKLFIWWGEPIEGTSLGKPGEVLSLNPCVVSTGKGNFQLVTVQLEGEDKQDSANFAKEHLKVGSRFADRADQDPA